MGATGATILVVATICRKQLLLLIREEESEGMMCRLPEVMKRLTYA
jgi:hypothetical protein